MGSWKFNVVNYCRCWGSCASWSDLHGKDEDTLLIVRCWLSTAPSGSMGKSIVSTSLMQMKSSIGIHVVLQLKMLVFYCSSAKKQNNTSFPTMKFIAWLLRLIPAYIFKVRHICDELIVDWYYVNKWYLKIYIYCLFYTYNTNLWIEKRAYIIYFFSLHFILVKLYICTSAITLLLHNIMNLCVCVSPRSCGANRDVWALWQGPR